LTLRPNVAPANTLVRSPVCHLSPARVKHARGAQARLGSDSGQLLLRTTSRRVERCLYRDGRERSGYREAPRNVAPGELVTRP
jgi:hypothetical protein